jgi:outer membrane lipoprotein-sorting protein
MFSPKKVISAAVAIAATVVVAGCSSQADTVSKNISTDADSYKIERQIVFYNGITGQYIAEVDGLCSIGNDDPAGKLSYTCKVGPDQYIKNYLGISNNVTWFALQTKAANADPYHYEVIFKPEEIIPNLQLQTSGGK